MQMRAGFVGYLVALGLAVVTSALVIPSQAVADQPQDWFISNPPDPGDYLTMDFLIGAFQANYSKEIEVYGGANQLTLRGGGLAALPFGRAAVGGDLRIVILSVGMDVGYENVWRGLQCGADTECTRKERRFLETGGEFAKRDFFFWQGRARLVLPFNDYALGVIDVIHNRDNSPDNFFDYQNGVMRDQYLTTVNWMLFGKHKDFGGFAPMIQQQYYSVAGRDVSQLNFGFTFLTRAGLARDNDLVVVQLLLNDPSLTGGTNLQDSFGNHLLRGPLNLLIAYRTVLSL